jgi:hypothetical protein
MPIASTDLLYKLSSNAGTPGPGNSEAGTPATSLGGFISTTQITDATVENLFANLSGDDNAASAVHYRCFFIHNNHGSLTLQGAVAWISAEEAGGADAAIALDGVGVTALASASAQADVVGDEDTAPAGETFSAPTTKGTGLSIGDIDAGEVQAIWVRRTATDSAAQAADGVTIRVEGDTEA